MIDEMAAKNTQLNPQECGTKLSPFEKIKYRSFTSKLSYMSKAALPIRKRKASFITTNDYRITSLRVLDAGNPESRPFYDSMQPVVRPLAKYQHLNVVFIGTGKNEAN